MPLIIGIFSILCFLRSETKSFICVSIEPSGRRSDIAVPFGPLIIMPSMSA